MDQLKKSGNLLSRLSADELIREVIAFGQSNAKTIVPVLQELQKAVKRLDARNRQSGNPTQYEKGIRMAKKIFFKKEREMNYKKNYSLTKKEEKILIRSEENLTEEEIVVLMGAVSKMEASPYLETEKFGLLSFEKSEEEYRKKNKQWFRRLDDEPRLVYLRSIGSDGSKEDGVYYDLIKIGDGNETGNVIPVPVFGEVFREDFQEEKEVISFLKNHLPIKKVGERKEVQEYGGRDSCHHSCSSCEFYSQYEEREEDKQSIFRRIHSYCSNEQWENDPSTGESWCVPRGVIMPTPQHCGVAPPSVL